MSLLNSPNDDRRRSPRFCCRGEAKIIRLPWDGLFLPARVKDLSLGGCCLALPAGLDCGMRAEILLRMNSGVFRAVGQVREIRGQSGVGMEFLRLSSGGLEMLQDLIRELARLQAHMDRLKSAREEEQKKLLLREIKREGLMRGLVRGRIPDIGTMLCEEKGDKASSESPCAEPILDDLGKVIPVDIFI